MRENTPKARWKKGEVTFGSWCSIPSAFSAEIVASCGFDWVTIDMQHGLIDYQVAVGMLQAISTTPTIPFVRVPWNEFGIIGKMLDAGAMGVIIPMVNSVEEAKQAVAACRYHPEGARSFGPIRASYYAGADYYAHANNEIAVIPMIETQRALDDLDAILSVPGIDAVYVGPADLSITLGLPPGMDNAGADSFNNALRKVVDTCRKHGVTPGIHAAASLGAKRASQGFQMITVSGDAGAIAATGRADLRTVRESVGENKQVYG